MKKLKYRIRKFTNGNGKSWFTAEAEARVFGLHFCWYALTLADWDEDVVRRFDSFGAALYAAEKDAAARRAADRAKHITVEIIGEYDL